MSQIIEVVIGGTPFDVYLYDANTMEAAEKAAAAAASAANAEAFSGPTYANQAAGEAATTTGEYFAVNASGIVSIYLRTGGGSTLQRVMLTTAAAAAAGGAAMVGKSGGGTVQDGLDDLDADKVGTEDVLLPMTERIYKQQYRTVPSFVSAAIPSLRVWGVYGRGVGKVSHNVHLNNIFRARWSTYMGGEGDPNIDVYVDWATGNDTTGTGLADAPYKTIKKAVSISGCGTVWVMANSEEILDLDGTLNLSGGEPRAIQIKAYTDKVTVYPSGTLASGATWTETAGGSTIWTFTNAAGRRAESILYSPTGDWKNARIIPFKGTGSSAGDATTKAGATFDGWSQNGTTGDVYLRFHRSMDINANKAKFRIMWAGATATPHKIQAGRYYFEGFEFLGGDGISLLDKSGFACSVMAREVDVYFMADKGWRPEDNSLLLRQNCITNRNSGDGMGSFDSAVTGDIDCTSDKNGPEMTYGGVTNAARNRQGISTHDLAKWFAIGGQAQENYGQNIANTTSNPAIVNNWAVGFDGQHPGQPLIYTSAVIDPFTAAQSDGVGYFDECVFGGPSADFGLVAGSGQIYAARNDLDGTSGDGSGVGPGGQIFYNPFAALPV